MSTRDDGGSAFPQILGDNPMLQVDAQTRRVTVVGSGMSLRDYFAVHGPEPSTEQIAAVAEREKNANPHGDTYKPPRRSWNEIRCALRYEWADTMLKARKDAR
jgi:hypothetical protein